jgi:hypothetical protein
MQEKGTGAQRESFLQKRRRPSRSDGGSCEKGVPSSGEKIVLTAWRLSRKLTASRSRKATSKNQLSGGGGPCLNFIVP